MECFLESLIGSQPMMHAKMLLEMLLALVWPCQRTGLNFKICSTVSIFTTRNGTVGSVWSVSTKMTCGCINGTMGTGLLDSATNHVLLARTLPCTQLTILVLKYMTNITLNLLIYLNKDGSTITTVKLSSTVPFVNGIGHSNIVVSQKSTLYPLYKRCYK